MVKEEETRKRNRNLLCIQTEIKKEKKNEKRKGNGKLQEFSRKRNGKRRGNGKLQDFLRKRNGKERGNGNGNRRKYK